MTYLGVSPCLPYDHSAFVVVWRSVDIGNKEEVPAFAHSLSVDDVVKGVWIWHISIVHGFVNIVDDMPDAAHVGLEHGHVVFELFECLVAVVLVLTALPPLIAPMTHC